MNNTNFSISFSKDTISDFAADYWLKMEQVGISDEVTIPDVANVLDAMYSTDPCTSDTTTDGGEEVPVDENGEVIPPVTVETYWEIVGDKLQFNICKNQDNQRTIQIKVYRSHQNEPYKVIPENGTIIKTVVKTEEIVEAVSITGESGYNLKYSFDSNLTYNWKSCVDERNNIISPPGILIDACTLKFGINVTALLDLSYVTIYDLIDISVPNKDDGSMGDCNLLAYYHGMVFTLNLQSPPVDPTMTTIDYSKVCFTVSSVDVKWNPTCYQVIEHRKLCACDGLIADTPWDTYEKVSCPEKLFNDNLSHAIGRKVQIEGYVNCGVDLQTGALKIPDYYKTVCCKVPSVSLPRCPVNRVGIYKGGHKIEGGVDLVKATYGDKAKMIPVLPSDGICGTHYIIQNIDTSNCCKDAPPVVWDSANSISVIPPSSSGVVFVTGGIPSLPKGVGNYVEPTYTWIINGTGFWLNSTKNKKKVYTTVPYVMVYTDSSACGSAPITVSDACTEVSGGIRSTIGSWIGQTGADLFPIMDSIPGVLHGLVYLGTTYDGDVSRFSSDNQYWIGPGLGVPIGTVGVPFPYFGNNVRGLRSGCLSGLSVPDTFVGKFLINMFTGCVPWDGAIWSRNIVSFVIYKWSC